MNKPFIMSPRANEMGNPVKGSVRIPCSRCNQDLWVSPATNKTRIRLDAQVICIQCLSRDAELAQQVIFTMSKEQMAEVAEHVAD